MKHLFLLLLIVFGYSAGYSQQVEYYQLDNGLTVIIDQNPQASEVFGSIVVNAGSKDEEEHATGLAHYLEHMLFKGTQTLGTANWEAEKALMDQIDAQYDKLQKAETKEEIDAIQKKINDLTVESAQYVIPNEFSALIQEMGGVGLNAATGKDLTYYFNAFPANQIEKWLHLYAHRLENPVFRFFQSELETVYEEKNRSADNPFTEYSDQLFQALFEGHPYGRPIIGYTDHLKKPNMTAMKKFFNTWYVPNNMALILSGNVNAEEIKPMIEETFGSLESKALPARNNPEIQAFKGGEVKKVKLTNFLTGVIAYRGAEAWSKDDMALTVAASILNNAGEYGLLDQLVVDGEVSNASASNFSQKDASLFLIDMLPVFDRNQRRQVSFKLTEKMIFDKLQSLKSGDFDEALLANAKRDLLRNFILAMETPQGRVNTFMNAFINGKSPDDVVNYYREMQTLTKADVVAAAQKYLGDDHLSFQSSIGKTEKETIEKPELKAIEAVKHEPSEFASFLTSLEQDPPSYHEIDFEKDVQTVKFQEGVDLHYVKNTKNNVFSMTIVFGAGEIDYPLLKYAVPTMNRAGIQNQFTSNEVKTEFAKLGVNYSFSYNGSYTYVRLLGEERNLAPALSLLSKLTLIPAIEDKAFDGIVTNEILNRAFSEKGNVSYKNAALQQYLLYGDKSSFIDRVDAEKLWSLRPSELIAVFQEALGHDADIHYYGQYSLDDAMLILKSNLALAADRKPSTAPQTKQLTDYKENTIYLVDDKEIRQAQVYLYQKGDPISVKDRALVDGLNQYIGGSFNGLMMKEIREYRALAYTASANIAKPTLPEWNSYLFGYIGTQADKTNDVVSVVHSIFSNMPVYEERFSNLQSYLLNSSQMATPSDRNLSMTVENWKTAGYEKDPSAYQLDLYKELSFNELIAYYNSKMKGKPIAIAILGDIKKIDQKELEKYGKVKKLGVNKLFSDDDIF